MIIKVCQFQARKEQGERLVQIFQPGEIDKAAEFFSMGKRAAPMLPEVQTYLDKLKPHPNKIYILVNALGAGEFWGSNINGDFFPEGALVHKGMDFGYETFYNAYPYKHHCNKDPEKSFGKVELVCWHNDMKRVELVVCIDRERAKRFAAEDVIDKLDQGMFPDVSMGCFRKGTPILLGSGRQKNIEDVVIGDSVITHLGSERKVTDVMVHDHKEIYKLKAYGHKEVWVTGEHPLWLARKSDFICCPSSKSINNGRKQKICIPDHSNKKGCEGCTTQPNYRFKWVPVSEAMEGDYLASPIPKFKKPIRILSKAEARILGYYLAEGHILKSNAGNIRGIHLSTGLHELENHLDIYKQAEVLNLSDNTSDWDDEPKNGKRISIWGAPDLAHLCLDFCGEGAHSKFLSTELLAQPPDVLLEFLGAYANGDGGTYEGAVYLSTCSELLARQLMTAALLCRMVPSLSIISHKPSTIVFKDTIEYQVWIGTDTSWKLRTTWKLTKSSKRQNSKRFFYESGTSTWLLTPIRELEKYETDEPVYNFSVEGHESYVANGLAVHNCKVPYDLCSKCLDWKKYRKAQSTFNHLMHRTVGQAVLQYHKRDPIRGLSVTRDDYCIHLRTMLNKILGDGTKIYAINDYPRFFDISFVFIGADKTAKVMAKLAEINPAYVGDTVPSWYVAEQLGYSDQPEVDKSFDKVASYLSLSDFSNPRSIISLGRRLIPEEGKKSGIERVLDRLQEKKASHSKGAEIIKDIVPSQFGSKAVPLEGTRQDLPNDVLDRLGSSDLSEALSTPTSMGMVLKPREFQRITIIRLGKKPLADDLDQKGQIFPTTEQNDSSVPMGTDHFAPILKRLLLPLMEGRSCFEPVVKRKIIRITIKGAPEGQTEDPMEEVQDEPLLQKISAAYNGYLDHVTDCFRGSSDLVNEHADLWSAVYKEDLSDGFAKYAAGNKVDPRVLFGAVGGAWAASEIAKYKRRQAYQGTGPPTGAIMDAVAENPKLLMFLAGMGAMHQQGSTIPKRIISGIKGIIKMK